MSLHTPSSGLVISLFSINTDRTDSVVPVLVVRTLHAIVAQIWDVMPKDGGPAIEIAVAEGDDGCASMNAYRADLIVEFVGKKGKAGAAVHAEIVV